MAHRSFHVSMSIQTKLGLQKDAWRQRREFSFSKIADWLLPVGWGIGSAHSSLWLVPVKVLCARLTCRFCSPNVLWLTEPHSVRAGPRSKNMKKTTETFVREMMTWILFAVIRAKLVGRQEVDAGNDIYGNTIKRIKYDVKQIKVRNQIGLNI